MQFFTFNLPVKPHIKKYLTSLYGDSIPAKLETDIGFVVLNTLASRLEAKVTRGYLSQLQNGYTEKVSFLVPFHYWYLTKKDISQHTSILLNRYFETRFEEDLCRFVDAYGSDKWGSKVKAIETFASRHGIAIEDDISFEGLKKMEYRNRKKNLSDSLRRLSPTQNLFHSARA